MDRYIVRVPRPKGTNSPSKPENRLRQTTIESLQGVVVVEEVWRLKSLLRVPGQSTKILLETLRKLDAKTPSRDVLKSTKIGHTINRLTKNSDPEVARLAAAIVQRWKTHFEAKLDKPLIEVKCDRQTEGMRQAARKHLANALGSEEHKRLAEAIERESFAQHGRLINHNYRRSTRALVFAIKNKPELIEQLVSLQLPIKDFVTEHKKFPKSSS